MNAKNDKPAFNQNAYIEDYKREHYERLALLLPKGMKEKIKSRAARKGLSMNGYIMNLIERDMNAANEPMMNE